MFDKGRLPGVTKTHLKGGSWPGLTSDLYEEDGLPWANPAQAPAGTHHQVGARAPCAPRDALPQEHFLREHPFPCGTHPPPSTHSVLYGKLWSWNSYENGKRLTWALMEPYSHAEGNSELVSGYKSRLPQPGRGWDKQILSWVSLSIQCCEEKIKQMLLGWDQPHGHCAWWAFSLDFYQRWC